MNTTRIGVRCKTGCHSAIFALFVTVLWGAVQCPASLMTGLQGYWQLNGDGKDRSGNGRDLTLQGGIGFAPGLMGEALDFKGDPSQYANRTGDDELFDFGSGDFTIQAWVNYNTTSGEQILLEKFSGQSGPGWTLTKLNSDQLHLWALNFTVQYTAPIDISLHDWHQVVAERSGADLSIYFDNQLLLSAGGGGGAITDTTAGLLVGRRNAADGRPFAMNGKMDELAIWNRALSVSELSMLWNQGAGQSMVPESNTLWIGALALVSLGVSSRKALRQSLMAKGTHGAAVGRPGTQLRRPCAAAHG